MSSLPSKRKRRKQIDCESSISRVRALDGFAGRLGLREDFLQAVPASIRTMVKNQGMVRPSVNFLDSGGGLPEQQIAADINKALRSRHIALPRSGVEISLVEMFTSFSNLYHTVKFTHEKTGGQAAASLLEKVSVDMEQGMLQGENMVAWEVDNVLIRHLRFDQRLLYHTLDFEELHNGFSRLRMRICSEPIRERRFDIENSRRRAWQIGSIYDIEGIDWVCITPQELKRVGIGASDCLPVYLQSHAIRNLEERVGFDKDCDKLLFDWVYHSLKKPNLVKMSSGAEEFLVEYRLLDTRIGYFVGTVVDDAVLLRTFLFLTMQGTPEAGMIKKALRTQRHGIEIMKLDRLESFVFSDLRSDPELRRILEECGCGQLFRLGDKIGKNELELPLLRDINLYLGRVTKLLKPGRF